jgi:hypothetical protein
MITKWWIQLIKNKTTAAILAVLTFILGTALLVGIIFYFFGYPLSSIQEHQLYVFLAILGGAVLASFVYGRGSSERASKAAKVLDESLGITVKEKDMWKILRTIGQMPSFVINRYVSGNINAVEEFEGRIKDYKSNLTDEDLLKIKEIIETPVPELQNILSKLYLETNMEQFKILADPKAESLIALNLQELKRVLFND